MGAVQSFVEKQHPAVLITASLAVGTCTVLAQHIVCCSPCGLIYLWLFFFPFCLIFSIKGAVVGLGLQKKYRIVQAVFGTGKGAFGTLRLICYIPFTGFRLSCRTN